MARLPTIRFAELTFLLVGPLLGISLIVPWMGAKDSQEVKTPESVAFPAGVADEKTEIAFVSNADGIDAVDLRSGSRRWRSTAAVAPLTLVKGGSELVAANFDNGTLLLVLVESNSGKTKEKWDSLAGVFVSPQTCAITTDLHDSVLRVTWSVHSRYKGGANLAPAVVERLNIDASGVVEVDLKSNSILRRERTKLERETNKHDWPNALSEVRFGGRAYAIAPRPGQDQGHPTLALVAREEGTEHVLWEYPLVGNAKANPRQRE